MSMRPGARIASPKSSTRALGGVRSAARMPTKVVTPSWIDTAASSITWVGVNNCRASRMVVNSGLVGLVKPQPIPEFWQQSLRLQDECTSSSGTNPTAEVAYNSAILEGGATLETQAFECVPSLSRLDRRVSIVGEWLSLVEHLV